jgi:hypothetical protein
MTTSLLLHCDGSNESTSFIDETGKTVTANGNAKISTAWSAFGGSSALFDGTGDYLSIASHADFGFGTGNYTLAARIKTSANGRVIFDPRTSSAFGTFYIESSTGKLAYWNGSTALVGTTNVADNNEHLVAWVRASGVLMMFVDGDLQYSGSNSNDFGSSRSLRIGMAYDNTSGFIGHMDEILVVKGEALWTSSFTPTENPFAIPTISGNVKDDTNTNAERIVRVYRRDTGALVKQVLSDEATGNFIAKMPELPLLAPPECYVVFLDDDDGVDYNAIIRDRVVPA